MYSVKRCSGASAKQALAGIRSCCKLTGHDTSALYHHQVECMVKAIKKIRSGPRKTPRLPITIPILAKMVKHLSSVKGPNWQMNIAVLTTGVYGLLRAGEFVKKVNGNELRRADVVWKRDCVELNIRASKTDIFRSGVTVKLFKNDSSTCPFASLKRASLGLCYQQ